MDLDYKSLAKEFMNRMEVEFESNPEKYTSSLSDLDFDIYRDELEEAVLTEFLEYLKDGESEEKVKWLEENEETVKEKLRSLVPEKFYQGLESEEYERRKDAEAYQRNPLGYVGMRQSDFL